MRIYQQTGNNIFVKKFFRKINCLRNVLCLSIDFTFMDANRIAILYNDFTLFEKLEYKIILLFCVYACFKNNVVIFNVSLRLTKSNLSVDAANDDSVIETRANEKRVYILVVGFLITVKRFISPQVLW